VTVFIVLDSASLCEVSFVHALTLNNMVFHVQFVFAVCLFLRTNSDCFSNVVNILIILMETGAKNNL
jgi:hypothetical protein